MILVIDNYDSFTYNLVQYMGEVTGGDRCIEVVRNDKITCEEISARNPAHIVISPGPCTPKEAGISIEVAEHFAESTPILGVCLGHQAIAAAFGGEIVRARSAVHGKTSQILHRGESIFANLPNPFTATRYHSLVVRCDTIPPCLHPLAWSEETEELESELMAFRHRDYPRVIGVQFHPESILTNIGKELLLRFLSI